MQRGCIMSDDFSPLAGFAGTARLFPLPNLVFFPQVMQPLHIFEPRYRQMTADALAGDRLIALVLLTAGLGGRLRRQARRSTRSPAWARSSPTRSWTTAATTSSCAA